MPGFAQRDATAQRGSSPTYAKRTRKQLIAGVQKRRAGANKTSRFVGIAADRLPE